MQDRDIVILGGARTAFTEFGGSLKDWSPTDLGVAAAKAALERCGLDAADVDGVIVGNVVQCDTDAAYLARHVGLKAGVPETAPALTVNRLCGSGLQAIVSAAQDLLLGEATVVLAGGTESLSTAPYTVPRARFGQAMGHMPLVDTLWSALTDKYAGVQMAITAENLAARYGIGRDEQDAFALASHQRAAAAIASGRLAAEIAPITLTTRKGETRVDSDEHVRADTTLAALAKLPARFKQDGTVTAGNASGINDGAAMLVVTTAKTAQQRGWKPQARLVSWAVAGVDPSIMGIGPVPASRKALERAGLGLDDMAVIEVNEAFAAQALAVAKALDVDPARLNTNGGAIAVGHPLAASGARLALTTIHELRSQGKQYGLASLCIGGGQGIAAVFEAL
ncbi:MAG: acetyl-CoA C-acetyltransferase [Candidatus Sericytochromatia bacterium]|nr:acetyl-CoA C-acetyltransferase [Candidatus Tanganyikabacteria bacterium]